METVLFVIMLVVMAPFFLVSLVWLVCLLGLVVISLFQAVRLIIKEVLR